MNTQNTMQLLGVLGASLGGIYGYTENKSVLTCSAIGIGFAFTAPISIPVFIIYEKKRVESDSS